MELTKAQLSRFESLGDNCEFGFVLRRLGIEDGGLFRWARVTPSELLQLLSSDLAGVYEFENLVPHNSVMVRDIKYKNSWHSQMLSEWKDGVLTFKDGEDIRKHIHRDEKKKLEYLINKFRSRTKSGECIFIIKDNGGIKPSTLENIQRELARLAEGAPVRVVEVSASNNPALWGTVTLKAPGWAKGYISELARYDTADKCDYTHWENILISSISIFDSPPLGSEIEIVDQRARRPQPFDSLEEEYERHFERYKVEFQPWLRTELDRPQQDAIKSVLKRRLNAQLAESSYIAPSAKILASPLHIGSGSFISGGAILRGHIEIGEDCSINSYAHLAGRVRVERGVRIASNASLQGFNHGTDRIDKFIKDQPISIKGIKIGQGTWIGANAVVLDGVTIGEHCVVAAGAVVTRSFPAYQVLAGSPARSIKDRRDRAAQTILSTYAQRVREQIPELVSSYFITSGDCSRFVDMDGAVGRVRPACDAVEICSMFDLQPNWLASNGAIEQLTRCQDLETGLVYEFFPASAPHQEGNIKASRYNTMALNYALETLGIRILHPIHEVARFSFEQLQSRLEEFDWKSNAWPSGDWVDCFASCLDINERHFAMNTHKEALFQWLDNRCDPNTGMWGSEVPNGGWLQAVNGFYRLTRGTYAQFNRPVPYVERSIDTILEHAENAEYFGDLKGNACNVLDVVQPLWLCAKYTDYRRREINDWVRVRLPVILDQWKDNKGFGFDLRNSQPSLQGTEMWLSIIYYMAAILGLEASIGFRPKGIHRPEPVT